MTEILRAGPDTRITLHFAVRLMDGTELDSTFGGDPAAFVWGDESLLPGFENALRGLKAGDRRSVFLEANKAFGDYNDDNVRSLVCFVCGQIKTQTLGNNTEIERVDTAWLASRGKEDLEENLG